MASERIVQLGEKNWQELVTKSTLPVLVDFWAEWCGPCKMLTPVLNELADELADKLTIGKVNVDENQELAGKFNIRSIPTLLVFKEGIVQEQMVGSIRKAELKEKLSAYI